MGGARLPELHAARCGARRGRACSRGMRAELLEPVPAGEPLAVVRLERWAPTGASTAPPRRSSAPTAARWPARRALWIRLRRRTLTVDAPWSTAIAALWPGMPLTPPPRRAPAPHSSTLRVRGLDAPARRPRPRPRRTATRGRGGRCCRRAGRARPRGRAACAPRCTARRPACARGSPRSARRARASSERSVAVDGRAPWRPRVAANSRAGMCRPKQRQRLRARGPQLGPEDRRVGQRVAVDLARRQRRDAPGGRPARRRPASCARRSLTWNVPANASRGSTCASRSRGSRASSMLTLSWAPSGGGSGGRLAEQAREHGAARRWRARARRRGARRPSQRTSARRVGRSRSPRRRARARRRPSRAARPSASVSAPMPPTGTSQSPVPSPITW